MASTFRVWFLVADEAVAHVYARNGSALDPVHTLTDPDAHAKDAEMRHGEHGRRGGREHTANATTSAAQEETLQHAHVFAREVAGWLAQARQSGQFDSLHVIAAPRFLGLLRKSWPKAVADVIASEKDSDLTHETAEDLALRFLATPKS